MNTAFKKYTIYQTLLSLSKKVIIQGRGIKMNEENNKTTSSDKVKNSKTTRNIIIGVLILVLAVYLFGAIYYGKHFPANTYVNGTKIGGMTTEEAEQEFTSDIKSHSISLVEKERTETIDATKLDMTVATGDQIKKLRSSISGWSWFANLTGKKNYDINLNITYDDEALKKQFKALECLDKSKVQKPVDAYIAPGDTQFEIVPEVLGNTVKRKDLKEAIENALTRDITKINLEKENLYKLPSVYKDDEGLKEALKQANQIAVSSITYTFGPDQEVVNYSTVKDWVKVSKKHEVSIDKDKVETYIDDLGKKYNTMGGVHNFKTSNGEKIRVVDGDYGWKINYDKEVSTLIKELKAGKTVSRDPKWEYKGNGEYSKKDDIGNSYVEVSISSQEVWLYVDGKEILNSSVVTGDPTKHADTSKGVYSITYKQSPAVLTGPNAGGGSYESHVSVWMPFNGNQGLHDAPWRGSFGGSEYKGNGSHGCVNCPIPTAKAIYKHVKAGFPVVVY